MGETLTPWQIYDEADKVYTRLRRKRLKKISLTEQEREEVLNAVRNIERILPKLTPAQEKDMKAFIEDLQLVAKK